MKKGEKIAVVIALVVMFIVGFGSGWESKKIAQSSRNKVITADLDLANSTIERTEKTFKTKGGDIIATYSYPKRSERTEKVADAVIHQCLYILAANLALPDEEATVYNLRFSNLLGRYSLMMMEELGQREYPRKEEVPKWSPPIKKRNPNTAPDVLEKGKNKKVEI